jgi:predicted restriction endonuclease
MTVDHAADTAWALLVRVRAGYRCERCGSRGPLEAHHIFHKHIPATRHDIDNGVCLCREFDHAGGCHEFAHSEPEQFLLWASDWLGQDRFEALRKRARHLEKRVPRP